MSPVLDPVATEWVAKLPATLAESISVGFDGPAWLAGWLEASARAWAEKVYLEIDSFRAAGRTFEEIEQHINVQGSVMRKAWDHTMASVGAAKEPWVAEAARRAARAYGGRLEELMDLADEGGQA